jgi:hypothetical protein
MWTRSANDELSHPPVIFVLENMAVVHVRGRYRGMAKPNKQFDGVLDHVYREHPAVNRFG